MAIKLHDSELKVMDVLWRAGDLPARQIAAALEVSGSAPQGGGAGGRDR